MTQLRRIQRSTRMRTRTRTRTKRESAMVGLIPDAAEEDPEVNENACILVCKTLSLKQIHALEIMLM